MKTGKRSVFVCFLTVISILLVLLLIATVACGLYLTYGIDSDIDELMLYTADNKTPSKLYAITEEGTLEEYGENQISLGMNNEYVSFDKIPQDLINAFIAIEDKRFYTHIGFDPITTAKAVFKYIFSQGSSPGGSTITQQLIKNLTGDDEVTVKRKLTEIMKAVKLEKVMTKEDILEVYLNTIYLSQGTYGVSAAARLYFNKSVEDLTLVESAAIAAITQAPTKWDPIINPDQNTKRRNIILNEMYQNGMIDQNTLSSALEEELILSPCYDKVVGNTSSWYTDAVIAEAITLLEEALDVSPKVAEHHLFQGGYRIIIAVNPELQHYAEEIYKNSSLFSSDGAQSAFVVLDPGNGNVLALVGGVGEKNANRVLNRATQTVRSPGSSLKPLSVFLPALEYNTIHYGSCIDDIPLYFNGKFPESGWPKNASGIYYGLVSLEKAVASSLNTASVSILERVGIDNSYRILSESLGISTLENSDKTLSSLALGGMTKGVSLLELTAAYSPLASGGIYSSARTVLEIQDSGGKTVVAQEKRQTIVCRESSAQTLTKLLEGVVTRSDGTARGALPKLTKISSVAGKTGTTSNQYDRWFVGYTPSVVGGIWVGYDEQKSLSGVAGKAHLTVWDTIMARAEELCGNHSKQSTFRYDLLSEVRYCTASGKIPTEACYADPRGNMIAVGFFTKETMPESTCDTHIALAYCVEGSGVAGNACPHSSVKTVGLTVVNRAFPIDITVRDSQYTAMRLPDGYIPYISQTDPYFKYYSPQGSYVGKSNVASPYNKFCTLHPPLSEISEKLAR
ncbi:MAG: transglycosylase domain-containing protein [Clostridia bacterium]|nr:transglycosylase domain-containing protein [Clostridia bacterium]